MKVGRFVFAACLFAMLVGRGTLLADSPSGDSSLAATNTVADVLLGQTLFGHYHVSTPGSCPAPEAVCSGTCTDLTSDINHCGSCDFECVSGRADPGCCSSSCADLYYDNNNCGSCGVVCPGVETCSAGNCVCGIDCMTDDDCGVCSNEDVCVAGACVPD